MKKFESIKVEIIAFTSEDFITTSFNSGGFTPGENEGPFVPAN